MMKRKRIYPAILMLMSFVVLPGCEKREGEEESAPRVTEELKEAGEHLKDAAREFGDLLTGKWERAREGAFEIRKDLLKAYKRNLAEANERLEEWSEQASEETRELREELAEKIAEAQEKLDELEKATAENWEAAQRAFNVAWQELRDAFAKALAEFKKGRGEEESEESKTSND